MRRRLHNLRIRLAFAILPGPAKFVAIGTDEADLAATVFSTYELVLAPTAEEFNGCSDPNCLCCSDPNCLCNVEIMPEATNG